jgi:hypothetical protein
MSFPNRNKRPIDTIDLTGDDDDDERPTASKAPKYSSSSLLAPPRSQASQFRFDEDGGNELVDELDASQIYGDSSYSSYELYGEYDQISVF